VFFNLSADAAYPSNGRPQTRLRIKQSSPNYKIGIRSTAVNGTVHYWNLTELTTDVGNWGMSFGNLGSNSIGGDNLYGVGVPACANTAIAVGAYSSEFYTVTNNLVGGAEASFSSNGPLMDGSLKPDISAPGVNVASSISSYTDNNFGPIATVDFNGRTYPFARFSGTSMSGPAVAGIAAILLEVNPFLSANQVKSILIETARTDNHTGAIPPHSAKWGWGKVNAYQAVKLALWVVGEQEIELESSLTVFPNPTSSEISINGIEGIVEDVQIIDMNGKSIYASDQLTTINVSQLNSGTYFVRLVVDGKVQQVKFVKE
jgi:subtilisin family serine protease